MKRYDTQPSNLVGKHIYHKIDALSVVFENCSMIDVLNTFGLIELISPDFLQIFGSRYLTSFGYNSDLRLNFDGIGLQVHTKECMDAFGIRDMDLLEMIDPYEFFSKSLAYIRLDMMGQALDYVRSMGVKIDELVFKPLPGLREGSAYHFTRVDFAYDLINYAPDFIKLCKAACELYQSSQRRISVAGIKSGVTYKSSSGSEDILYLGKGAGDRCLRIYDKKLQFENAKKYTPEFCNYYDIDSVTGEKVMPESWIRIELQTRREHICHGLLYGENASFLSIFRFIYDTYAIREGQGLYQPVCEFWHDLFNWDEIPVIIQNAKYVNEYNDPVARAKKYVEEIALIPLLTTISSMGFKAFILYIQEIYKRMQLSTIAHERRRASRVVTNLLLSNHSVLPEHIYNRNGVYEIRKDYLDSVSDLYKYKESLEE